MTQEELDRIKLNYYSGFVRREDARLLMGALDSAWKEREELRETVKVLSERLADMAVERDRGSLSPASECIGTQEMAELKKDCLRALSCLYVSVEESIANDVKAKVVAYISALECALAEALTDKDEFEGRLNDIYSVVNLGVVSPRQTITLATHDDALRYSAELSIKKEGSKLTASLVALHELRP